MQIPSIIPPLITPLQSQELVAKAAPVIQAAPALTQRSIEPSSKSGKSTQSRNHQDRAKDGEDKKSKPGSQDGGHSVNLSV